jgi:pimeloyl-ACP methyl ester carboxylesterase
VFSVSGDPSPEEGYPTVASLSRYRGPILLISSAEDPVFPPGTNAAIAAAHRGPETVLAIPGALHALALLDGPDGTKVRVALDRFLANVLA